MAVVDENAVEVSSRHNNVRDARVCNQPQLSREDGFGRGDFRHALGMLACQDAHAVSKARIQDECFHFLIKS